jgi:hypothetical protein
MLNWAEKYQPVIELYQTADHPALSPKVGHLLWRVFPADFLGEFCSTTWKTRVFRIQLPCAAGTSSGSIMKSSTVRKQNSSYRSTGIFFARTFTRTQATYLFYTFICLSAVSNKLEENKIVLLLLKNSRVCFLNVSVKIVFFFNFMNILLLYLLCKFLCSFRICVPPKGDILGHY